MPVSSFMIAIIVSMVVTIVPIWFAITSIWSIWVCM